MSALRCEIPVPGFEQDCYNWQERHDAKCAWAKAHRAKVIFFGESITHYWTNEPGQNLSEGLWDELFSGEAVLNLGYGYDRTQNVLWRIDHGEIANQSPDLIVINIGTNQFSISPRYSGDTPEVAAAGIIAVVEKLHALCPKAHIVLMALFPRRGKMESIKGVNAILHEKAASLPIEALIDLGDQFTDENGELIVENYKPDGCHLSRPGYEIWGRALQPFVEKYCK